MAINMRQLCANCIGILLCAGGSISPAIADDSAFFIDTPKLITIAAEAAYAKYADIVPNGLVAENDSVQVSCRPDQSWTSVDNSNSHCPMPRVVLSQCSANINFLVRSSIKSDVTALSDGMCRTNTDYERISVEIYKGGQTTVNRSRGSSSGTGEAECSGTVRYVEIDRMMAEHQKALANELESYLKPRANRLPEAGHREMP